MKKLNASQIDLDSLKSDIQDENHRFVTDTEKSTWNAKETTAGSQEKADKALSDAKEYTDEQIGDIQSILDKLVSV